MFQKLALVMMLVVFTATVGFAMGEEPKKPVPPKKSQSTKDPYKSPAKNKKTDKKKSMFGN